MVLPHHALERIQREIQLEETTRNVLLPRKSILALAMLARQALVDLLLHNGERFHRRIDFFHVDLPGALSGDIVWGAGSSMNDLKVRDHCVEVCFLLEDLRTIYFPLEAYRRLGRYPDFLAVMRLRKRTRGFLVLLEAYADLRDEARLQRFIRTLEAGGSTFRLEEPGRDLLCRRPGADLFPKLLEEPAIPRFYDSTPRPMEARRESLCWLRPAPGSAITVADAAKGSRPGRRLPGSLVLTCAHDKRHATQPGRWESERLDQETSTLDQALVSENQCREDSWQTIPQGQIFLVVVGDPGRQPWSINPRKARWSLCIRPGDEELTSLGLSRRRMIPARIRRWSPKARQWLDSEERGVHGLGTKRYPIPPATSGIVSELKLEIDDLPQHLINHRCSFSAFGIDMPRAYAHILIPQILPLALGNLKPIPGETSALPVDTDPRGPVTFPSKDRNWGKASATLRWPGCFDPKTCVIIGRIQKTQEGGPPQLPRRPTARGGI
jgi:hypothetical protein